MYVNGPTVTKRRHIRTASFLSVGLALALASVSLAFAAWDDQITVSGTVHTGTMQAQWLTFPVSCTDNEGGSDVGHATANREPGNDRQMNFIVSDAYLGYQASCSFEWTNNGTVPLKIQSLSINGTPVSSGVATAFDLDGDTDTDVQIRFSNGVGSSYDPGEGGGKAILLTVLAGAPEGTPLTFTGNVNFVLWNAP